MRASNVGTTKGKLTARDRIKLLLDRRLVRGIRHVRRGTAARTSAWRISAFRAMANVTGIAAHVSGHLVFVFSEDFTVFGGSLDEAHAEKICKIMDNDMRVGAQAVRLNDSGGARIHEGVASLIGLCGSVDGATCWRPAWCSRSPSSTTKVTTMERSTQDRSITDAIFRVSDSADMFVTGPDVVKTVTHEVVTARGARRRMHSHRTLRHGRPGLRE